MRKKICLLFITLVLMFIFSSCKTDNSKVSDVVNKIKGFVRTKKVTSSDLSISDYFKDVLKTKGPNAYLRIEIDWPSGNRTNAFLTESV